MTIATIGLDLAKSVFQIHGVDAEGRAVLRRRLRRPDLLSFFERLAPCIVAMEACSSAHHWARELVALGHDVRLIPPQYAKPYVKRNKTDAADAEAICEAAGRPTMRFVPIKTKESQALLALHRVRSLLVRQRTAAVNSARGLLGEFGIVAPKGIQRVGELRNRMEDAGESVLPHEARLALTALFDHLDALSVKIGTVEDGILAWHKTSKESRRLATAPGVGPLTATALVAAIGDGAQFQSARHFAAWLGLTPRISASGGREHIGRISTVAPGVISAGRDLDDPTHQPDRPSAGMVADESEAHLGTSAKMPIASSARYPPRSPPASAVSHCFPAAPPPRV
jgi:transposase